jgi:hypothetical protein
MSVALRTRPVMLLLGKVMGVRRQLEKMVFARGTNHFEKRKMRRLTHGGPLRAADCAADAQCVQAIVDAARAR